MMRFINPAVVSLMYGLAVIGSGVMRYLERPDGEKGLWFGVVMGVLALFASLSFSKLRFNTARIAIWISILFVGSWFIYEALVKKGFAVAETRMIVIIGLTLVAAVYFLIECLGRPGIHETADENS